MNRPFYKSKYQKAKKFIEILAFIVILLSILVVVLFDAANKNKNYAASLESSQNIMVWTMDESCFQQLQDSEGIIRLQVDK